MLEVPAPEMVLCAGWFPVLVADSRTGEAITFITAEEETKWREIERGLARRFSRQPWPAGRHPAPAQ